jgi:hypothetical protein
VRGKWGGRGRLVWAVAAYKEGWVCRSVWACGVGLVASGWARGAVECVCGAQDRALVGKDQRER